MADINKNIAPIYDASETYDIGTIVNKDNKLYTYLGEDEEMQEVFLSDLIRGKAVSKLDLEPELLWENPSPTSAFAAQTVALDLSEYDSVKIEYINNTNAEITSDVTGFNGDNCLSMATLDENNYCNTRTCSISNSGIEFRLGYYINPSSVLNNNRTDVIIPNKIYGVKKLVSNSADISILKEINETTMSETSISLNNTKFDHLIISCVEEGHVTSSPEQKFGISKGESKTFSFTYTNYSRYRTFTLSDDGNTLTLSNGYQNFNGIITYNNCCVPRKIVGIDSNFI